MLMPIKWLELILTNYGKWIFMTMYMHTLHCVPQIQKQKVLWYNRKKRIICSSGHKDIGRIISVVNLTILALCIRSI